MHNPQFSPRHHSQALPPPPHPQMSYNQLHQLPMSSPPQHLLSGTDMNNNSPLHLYNQPSLLLATPMPPPLPPHPLIHSSASSEAGPVDSDSNSPTDSSESTLSSNHSGSNPNLATPTSLDHSPPISCYPTTTPTTTHGGGQPGQQQFYQYHHHQHQHHHHNGIIAQLAEDCQKMGTPPLANSQYVSLFIV